jgi:hypothetical protein
MMGLYKSSRDTLRDYLEAEPIKTKQGFNVIAQALSREKNLKGIDVTELTFVIFEIVFNLYLAKSINLVPVTNDPIDRWVPNAKQGTEKAVYAPIIYNKINELFRSAKHSQAIQQLSLEFDD